MAKKTTRNSSIKNAQPLSEEAYVSWGDDLDSKQKALKTASQSLDEYTLIDRAVGNRRYNVDFSRLDTNTGGRPGLTRSDYDFFRPQESIPTEIKRIIAKAEDVYQRVGLVKNVIDLMGDFAAQGIRLSHKNKRIERFYRQWFKKVKGRDRSERFLNNIYKTGNVVINRQTAKLNLKVADQLYKAVAGSDLQINELENNNLEKREVPWRYTFIDPVFVDVAAGPLSSFVSNKKYELVLPAALRKIINTPKTDAEKEVIAQLPSPIIEAAKTKKAYPLDPEKTLVYHYKKDDWQTWAFPMIYAIMDDIVLIEKLKLADTAALDGAISNIRIFKLGSLEHKIAPTKAATAKLAQILGNNMGGGTMDLVWGPDIELIESKTNVHQFLGEGKYIPHLNSVYAGLGIPPTLTGTFGAAGTTNNFISLKTLTQRLQYGRDILVEFWEKEIAIVQKTMGFKYAAKIEFDRMDLSNEDAEKALLVQLVDRNLISDELLQTRFGIDPDMEKTRLNRENRDRKSERMVNKAGPWFDPQFENSLKKIALQNGSVAPSQVGLELDKKKSGEKSALEMKVPASPPGGGQPVPQGNKGVPQQGRPKLSKDTEKRKTKEFSPQTGASLEIWANNAQDKISEVLNPVFLDFYKKKNWRSLSSTETKEADLVKTKILFSFNPFSIIDETKVLDSFSNVTSNEKDFNNIINGYNVWIKNIKNDLNKDLSVEEQKQAKASFYSMVYSKLES